ncbi:SDR family oxidoreductase [Oceanibaculum pacificum]|uniref:NAD(P)-dependent oxidoreductase n=1 Tax=Oceanibaculum pacificum TaxID=580166 RepID=A0A154VW04_9PROT|nr:SDR family oxidoreductase [Oceanibaculum pacificum]KZD05391.1 NAD(P)-dependent oxidoreductase [Oceanibaculum pacificum]
MSKTLFCFGLGYVAERLARRLMAQGWRVGGTARDEAKRAALRAQGIEAQGFDDALPEGVTHILSSIPPADGRDPVLALHGADLRALPGLRWAGYLSTTGVYGEKEGGWVDEQTPLSASTPSGQARVAAEAEWRSSGLPVHFFRLAGIYGPGRSAIEQLRAGTARRIVKPGQVFNRIHADDIGSVLIASLDRPDPGAAYNLADDEPASSADVIAYAAGLLGIEPPPEIPFEQAELSPMGRAFYSENKRVSNARLKRDLGVALAYPTYREGLAAILTERPA